MEIHRVAHWAEVLKREFVHTLTPTNIARLDSVHRAGRARQCAGERSDSPPAVGAGLNGSLGGYGSSQQPRRLAVRQLHILQRRMRQWPLQRARKMSFGAHIDAGVAHLTTLLVCPDLRPIHRARAPDKMPATSARSNCPATAREFIKRITESQPSRVKETSPPPGVPGESARQLRRDTGAKLRVIRE
jgi:hypothetical protein